MPLLSPPTVFVGIDWGGSEHEVRVLDHDGTTLTRQRVSHDRDGLEELYQLLSQFAEFHPVVAIERAEGLLVERLQANGWPVYCISPKLSARARERYRLANTKSDAFDAYVLADSLRLQHEQWHPMARASDLTAELACLARDRERITQSQRQVESRLRATLEAYHPAPLHLFSSLDRDITLAFIRDYPNPHAASAVGVERMRRFLRRNHYSGRTSPEELTSRLKEHLLQAAPGSEQGRQRLALHLVDQLSLLNTQLDDYDKALAELVPSHPDGALFLSFPGIGPVIAATLIGEMGDDRSRYPHAAALLADAGLAPVTRASGRTRQVRFRYAANHHLRHAIDWWMTVAARDDPWSHEIYQTSRAAGQGRYRAYRGLGARWTRILWRAWTDHQPYDTERHHAPKTQPDTPGQA